MATSRVRVYFGCSLDGCIAGPDHDLSFLMEERPDAEEREGLQRRNDLCFEPPTTHGRGMVQVTARVRKRPDVG